MNSCERNICRFWLLCIPSEAKRAELFLLPIRSCVSASRHLPSWLVLHSFSDQPFRMQEANQEDADVHSYTIKSATLVPSLKECKSSQNRPGQDSLQNCFEHVRAWKDCFHIKQHKTLFFYLSAPQAQATSSPVISSNVCTPISAQDLKSRKKQDPFLYYSIPGIRDTTVRLEHADMHQVAQNGLKSYSQPRPASIIQASGTSSEAT